MTDDDKQQQLDALYQSWKTCQECKLCEHRTQSVFGQGSLTPKIVFVGDGPGREDDKLGVPFVSAAGTLLIQMLSEACPREDVIGKMSEYRAAVKTLSEQQDPSKRRHWVNVVDGLLMHLRGMLMQDIYFTNSVLCPPLKIDAEKRRPAEYREPDASEYQACLARLQYQIYTLDPVLIVAAGGAALSALTGKKQGAQRTRGILQSVVIPGRLGPVNYSVLPILSPAFLLKNDDRAEKRGKMYTAYRDLTQMFAIAYGVESVSRNQPHLRYLDGDDKWELSTSMNSTALRQIG